MDIVFQAHHAVISARLQQRSDRLVRGLARRLGRVTSATVRFEGDGPQRRVELMLHAAGGRLVVAEGTGRYYGPALANAASRVKAQIAHLKRPSRRHRADKGNRLAAAS